VLHANEHVQHEQVTVYGQRIDADNVDSNLLSSHVSVIHSSDFSSSQATVADILSTQAGVQIRSLGGVGSYASASIRGASGAQVNVFVDGVLINDAYSSSVDLSQFLLQSVDRIEIYRGSAPVQLGGAGIGGVINIVTKLAKREKGSAVSAGLGSFGTKRLGASHGFAFSDESHSFLAADYLGSDNNFKFINDNRTPNNPADDLEQRRNNAGLEQFQLDGSTHSQIAPSVDSTTSISYSQIDQEIPDLFNLDTTEARLETQTFRARAQLNYSIDKKTALAFEGAILSKAIRYEDLQSRVGIASNLDEYSTLKPQAAIDYRSASDFGIAHIRALFAYEKYEQEDLIRSLEETFSRTSFELGLQQDAVIFGDGTIVANYRLFTYRDEKESAQSSYERNEHSFGIGLDLPLWSNAHFLINMGQAVRTPTIYELFGDRGLSIGNEELKPETAYNFDAGLKFKHGRQNLSMFVFHRELRDAIINVYDSRGVGRAENLSEARITGVEFDYNLALSDALSFITRLTEQRTKDLSERAIAGGASLPNQFESSYFSSINYLLSSYSLAIDYLYQSDAFYAAGDIGPIDTVRKLNARVGYTLLPTVQFEFVAENILDEQIEYFNGFPGPGLGYVLSMIAKF
jgi:iron complex outermembrane receptor protein